MAAISISLQSAGPSAGPGRPYSVGPGHASPSRSLLPWASRNRWWSARPSSFAPSSSPTLLRLGACSAWARSYQSRHRISSLDLITVVNRSVPTSERFRRRQAQGPIQSISFYPAGRQRTPPRRRPSNQGRQLPAHTVAVRPQALQPLQPAPGQAIRDALLRPSSFR